MIEELGRSSMSVEFSSFEAKREPGKQIFACRIRTYIKGEGFKEYGKGYGDDPMSAFNKAYNNMNQTEGAYRD